MVLPPDFARNPRIRDILLRQDPDEFIAVMQKWAQAFNYRDDTPMPGITAEDFARLTMPVLLFRSGKSDMAHTRRTSEWVHELLPNATLQEPPWGDHEWLDRVEANFKDPTAGLFRSMPKLVPQITEFAKKIGHI